MTKKRLLLSMASIGAVAVSATMFAAFEAHVINVTAKIENALKVDTEEISFGTVFPQEELDKKFTVALSDSFKSQNRVNEVDYIIRQKPKCAVTNLAGTLLISGFETKTGHVKPDGSIDCGNAPKNMNCITMKWGPLPSLCEYLSKHKEEKDNNQPEKEVNAFHPAYVINGGNIKWTEASGILNKAAGDINDGWIVDLKVPCFGDYCAQDWHDFVEDINPQADPDDYVLDAADQSKVFGCDLWIEVTDVKKSCDHGC